MNCSLSHRRALFLLPAILAGCQDAGPEVGTPVARTLLLVTVEGLGATDIGCAGRPGARTPHLDRLARSGMQALSARSPIPGRPGLASVLTGRLPAEHGLLHEDFFLADGFPTIASIVADRGVRTAAFAGTAAADRRHGLGRGFERHAVHFESEARITEPWREPGHRPAISLASELSNWLGETEDERRSFAWIHLGEAASGDVAAADRGLGHVLRSAGNDVFVVVTSPHGAAGTREVPFVAGGSAVPATIRTGLTSTEDASAILGAAFAGEDFLRDALAAAPADRIVPEVEPPALELQTLARLEAARFHDRADRVQEARAAYDAVLADEPRLVPARARAAELARRAVALQDAFDHASALLTHVPEHPEACVIVSRVLLAQKDVRARPLLTGVLDASPHHPQALAARADLALEGGDPQSAVTDLRHALVSARDDPDALLEVAQGLSRAGLHADAIRTVSRAIARDRSPRARYTLAFVMERAERYPESVHEYLALIDEHPEYLPPYRNLGVLMARDGELERAIGLWERGLAYHPDDPSLRANIDAARHALGLGTLGG